PGTLIDTELLAPTEASFLAAVAIPGMGARVDRGPRVGLAALDLTVGEYWVQEFQGHRALADLLDELSRLEPRELLHPPDLPSDLRSGLDRLGAAKLTGQDPSRFDLRAADTLLREQFRVASLDSFGCQELTLGLQAAGAVLRYLRDTQPTAHLDHLRKVEVRRPGSEMHLDSATIRNLEVVRALAEDLQEGQGGQRSDQPGTLLAVLDRTVTAMGTRLIREWIVRPLLDAPSIRARHDAVDELVRELEARTRIRSRLRTVQDLARLGSRLVLGAATPRDLFALKESLAALPDLRQDLASRRAGLLRDLAESWDDLVDVRDRIEGLLLPDPPLSIRDGGLIKDGAHPRVDELRKACREGRGWMTALEAQERERTGIESLKVRFNQVFGYYLEVTNANLGRVPAHYIRKQTLVNAERFITPELKELEDRVTGADQQLKTLEQELFEDLRLILAKESPRIQAMARFLAILDVLTALAETSAVNGYVKPDIDEGGTIRIADGRHPVVERRHLPGGFIPNDTYLNLEGHRLLIITGPNMAGKSTYLRQVALIVLMAQMGSFVPAREARIGLVDRIFTRVGASDNLAAGQSTFMVEMTETAQILHCATSRSLILLDEIGRGTSTYDGLSIAWAVAEFIHDRTHLGGRTLFATHYHEMTELARQRDGIRNYTVAVKEQDEDVLFLRKIVEGAADRSYGIHVAKLAGLPPPVIARAQEVLAQLEASGGTQDPVGTDQEPETLGPLFAASGQEGHSPAAASPPSPPLTHDPHLPPPHPIIEEVRQMDLFSMTPLEALNRLAELQRRLDRNST
ncbi:MAG: DNA mismatch repair protein MutS, partial [Nitrospirales bacterium]